MTQELGKVERPEAAQYQGKRKLYLVPLIHVHEGAPVEYVELCGRYWQGVQSSLLSLEVKAGKVLKVFHEGVFNTGEEGLKMVEKMDARSYDLVRRVCESGAMFEALEDAECFGELMDWSRCLSIGLVSRTAATKISQEYVEANKKRNEHIAKRIAEALGPEEAGLLLISEGHKVQFSADIEVFYIAPPALDEVHRWERDYAHRPEQPGQESEE
ncbi:MAG: hypothetical protein HYX87_02060 [Chloroflexi bacterium]|nr:hypothetical protein [Chloroflexota bacterium]